MCEIVFPMSVLCFKQIHLIQFLVLYISLNEILVQGGCLKPFLKVPCSRSSSTVVA